MNAQSVNAARIQAQRVGAQQLPYDAVRHMTAMQAQDYYGALWSLGVRTGLSERQVIEALEQRRVIRTWPQRGTLHWVAPEDAAWMTALSAPRLLAGARRRQDQLDLSPAILARSKELIVQALEGGKSLTRPQMMELLEAVGISTKGGRGYHILWHAAQAGLIYIGPMQAKQQTFGLLADLPVKQRHLSREESIIELAGRYFRSHGPATLQDFMWWSGLTAAEAKAGLAANEGKLESEALDGKLYWWSGETKQTQPIEVMLLPGFDEYILGYRDRQAQMDLEHGQRVVPGGNGMFMPTVVYKGRVVGLWKRTIKKAGVAIEYDMFLKLPASAKAALQTAEAEYAEFLDLPLLKG